MKFLCIFSAVFIFVLASSEAANSLPQPVNEEVTCSLEEEKDDKPKELLFDRDDYLVCIIKLLKGEIGILNKNLEVENSFLRDEIQNLKVQIQEIISGPGDRGDTENIWDAAKVGSQPAVVYWLNQDPKNIGKNDGNNHNYTALLYATSNDHLPVVEYLVFKGADVNAVNSKKNTALMVACIKGLTSIAEFLIKKGANINHQNIWKQTPLHWAAEKDHLEVVKVLIKNGADRNIKDENGRTPLEYAKQLGKNSVAQYLASL